MTDFTTMEPVGFKFEDGHTVDAWWREEGISTSETPAGWHRYAVMGGRDDDEWEPCAIRMSCLVNHTADIITPTSLDERIHDDHAFISDWWFDRDRPAPDLDGAATERIRTALAVLAAKEPADRIVIPVDARDAIAQAITGRPATRRETAALELAFNMFDREDRPDQWVIDAEDLPALERDYQDNLARFTITDR